VRIAAFDRAGNSTSTVSTVSVEALDTPRIVSVPESALVGSPITLRGETYPNGEVIVMVRFNDGEAIERRVVADAQGAYVASVVETAREGEYETIIIAVDEREARSLPTAPARTVVTQPTLMLFGTLAVNYLSVFGALVGLVFFLIAIVWLSVIMLRSVRGRVRTETAEAVEVVHAAFTDIKHDARSLVRVISKASQRRPLTDEEELVIATMQRHLEEAEEHITKEIDDIEETTHVVVPHRVQLSKLTPPRPRSQ
jgi:hypothetical protein